MSEITSADVQAVLVPLWHAKRPTAQSVRQRIGTVMKWTIAKGFRPDNPAGDAISAALPHGEVGSALARISVSAGAPGPRLAIEFLVLTAARSAGVRGAGWREINLDAATWEILGEQMKAGKPHRVPLSGQALEVLTEARKRFGDSDLEFRSARGKAVTNAVLLRVLRRCGVTGTVHGFRTSLRSWAAEEDVDRQVAEMALAHAVKGVEGAYQRRDLLERRRIMMQA